MTARSLMLLGSATMVIWVVPSIGTQGMGTIGQRVAHPDAIMFDADPAQRTAARTILAQSDAEAETALGL